MPEQFSNAPAPSREEFQNLADQMVQYAVVSGTAPSSAGSLDGIANYPAGFTQSNCWIVSVSVNYGNGSYYYQDERFEVVKSPYGISFACVDSTFTSKPVKVVLAKIPNITD